MQLWSLPNERPVAVSGVNNGTSGLNIKTARILLLHFSERAANSVPLSTVSDVVLQSEPCKIRQSLIAAAVMFWPDVHVHSS